MFCWHDWIPFRKSVENKYSSTRRIELGGETVVYYEHFYSVEKTKTGTNHYHSLGLLRTGEFIANFVCSKCFKLSLDLQKALKKSKKLESS